MGDNNNTKIIVAGVFAGLVFAALAMGGAAWVLLGRADGKAPKMGVTGSIASAASGDYKPTSQWIEAGLDPDKVVFDMKSGAADSANAPEIRDIDGDIHNAVMSRQNELMQCYATVLQDEDVQGKVDMQFGIASDGHVAMVKVTKSTLASKRAEDCFVKTARGWSFPSTGRATLTKFDTDFGFYYE